MFSESLIDPAIIKAYRETDYHVHGDVPFTLTIGAVSPALLTLQAATKTASSAFITACNPFSEATVDTTNADRQRALSSDLHQRGLKFINGIGMHPSNQWAGEPSLLVPGVSLDTAKTLGVYYEQNAIVWSGPDGIPRLILLR